jgi:hypothetical protein
MKINLFALGRAARALIITSVIFCVIGWILCPERMGYTPEDPAMLANQQNFALATLLVGIFAGSLIYWDATKS